MKQSTITSEAVVGQITKIHCRLTLVNSTVGSVKTLDLSLLSNALFTSALVPLVNKVRRANTAAV